MKTQRNSSVEILRFILMFFIVIWHSIVHGIDLPHIDNIPHWGFAYYLELILCTITCISVDCFMFISGYYGIRFTWKGLLSIVFFCMFYSIGIAFLNKDIITSHHWMGILCPLSTSRWWFMSSYIIVFLLSDLIERHIMQLTKRTFLLIICLIYVLHLYHLVIGKISGEPSGSYTLMIAIYLAGRYYSKYGHLLRKPWTTYLTSTLLMIGLISFLLYQTTIPQSVIWQVYNYANPLILLASISLFELFRRRCFISEKINYLSGSVLSIYLITDSQFVRTPLNTYLYEQYQNSTLLYILLIVCIMIVCITIDQIRRFSFNLLYKCLLKLLL